MLSGNTSGCWYPDAGAGSSAGHELSLREPDGDWDRAGAGCADQEQASAGQQGKWRQCQDTDRDTPAHPGVIRTNISSPSSLNNGHQTFHLGLILHKEHTACIVWIKETGSWFECPEYLIRQEQNDIKIIPPSLSQLVDNRPVAGNDLSTITRQRQSRLQDETQIYTSIQYIFAH